MADQENFDANVLIETGNSAGDKPERRRTLQVNLGF